MNHTMLRPARLLFPLVAIVLCSPVVAQEAVGTSTSFTLADPAAQPNYVTCESSGTQPVPIFDCGALRSRAEERGVTFAGRSTHFGFGVDGGVRQSPVPALGPGDVFKYTGRGEYDAIFDLEKFGGLPHGKLLVRLEHWYGEYGNVSLRTGSFSPAVFPAAVPPTPNDPGRLYVTNFVATQPLSENFVVFAGKKDVLGAADQDEFAGGDGTHQFVNQAFIANPAFLLGLPYTGIVAGFASPQDWGMFSGFVYDPKDRTQDFFDLGDLYAKGVIVGGEVKVNTNFFGRSGDHHVGGMWKHVKLTDLRFNEPPPGVYPEPTVPGFPTLSNSWTLSTTASTSTSWSSPAIRKRERAGACSDARRSATATRRRCVTS